MKFPNDSDGQVLKMLYNNGVDFNIPVLVDFQVSVPNKENGEKLVELFSNEGFKAELNYDDEFEEWTCELSKRMLLDYQEIINIQNYIDEISEPLGGYSDGWGTFGE